MTDIIQGSNPTSAQKEARSIVEMFAGIMSSGTGISFNAAKQCAMIYVQGILGMLYSCIGMDAKRWTENENEKNILYRDILSEIEKM